MLEGEIENLEYDDDVSVQFCSNVREDGGGEKYLEAGDEDRFREASRFAVCEINEDSEEDTEKSSSHSKPPPSSSVELSEFEILEWGPVSVTGLPLSDTKLFSAAECSPNSLVGVS